MSTGDKYFQNCSSTTIDSTNIDKEYSYKSRYDLYSSISTFVGKQRNMEQSLIANNNDSVNAGKYMDYNEDYSAFYTKMNSKWLYNKIEKLDEETIYENLEGLTIDVKQTDDYILYSGKGIRKEDGDDLYEVHYYLVIDNNSDTYYNANYCCIGSNDNRGYNKYSEKQFISDAIKNYQNSQKLKFFLTTWSYKLNEGKLSKNAQTAYRGNERTWGIFADSQVAAKSLAVVLRFNGKPEIHQSGQYRHYHDKDRKLHIWFGKKYY